MYLTDDGFKIQIADIPARKCISVEVPKGMSLWEGNTCIMKDCTGDEIIARLASELDNNYNGVRTEAIKVILQKASKDKGFFTFDNKNKDAPFIVIINKD